MTVKPDIRRVIEDTVRQRFDDVPIVRVDVSADDDHDGDPSLYVRIVFDAEIGDLRAEKLVSITRHLRDRLFELDEYRFPYTRFLSKEDFEDLAA